MSKYCGKVWGCDSNSGVSYYIYAVTSTNLVSCVLDVRPLPENPFPVNKSHSVSIALFMQQPVYRSLYLVRNSLHDIIKNKYVLPSVSAIPFVKSKLPHGDNQWRSWLSVCATSRMVAGSIPDFLLANSSGRTMVLGSTRPLTKLSTSVTFWVLKAADAQG
jgi:hypothetical protein